jgi:maltooligosyltrehalose trehalohydrolase
MIAMDARLDTPMIARRYPQGAECGPGGVHFRVWAPDRDRVDAVLEGGSPVPLESEGDGHFSGWVAGAGAGTLYRYRLDGTDGPFPDPISRFQPDGPHGPSRVVDPAAFAWTDVAWRGVPRSRTVLYELHVGTFTPEGTWAAAMEHLPRLAGLGVTAIEMMPVAEFSGRFGWGYDGVDFFAPTRLYGEPDDLRRFVDRAHALGLAVILDVVYNHAGPDGNYLKAYAAAYFTDRYENEWGEAVNFDGPDSGPVRAFVLANARYWIEEFHLDGLRLDAIQQIFDRSSPGIVAEIARTVRAAAGGRETFVVGENEPQDTGLLRGDGALDALWNDDFHHSARVALTGRREAYYTDYPGQPQEFVSAAKWGFLFAGQTSSWQGKRRGRAMFDLSPARLVCFLENHDQLANSARGWRLDRLAAPSRLRAMTAYLLLIPAIPMLFQGQEFAASAPFHYFADHETALAEAVRRGRAEFLAQFPSIARTSLKADLPDPADEETFRACRLDHREWTAHAPWVALHRDLLALRRDDPAFAGAGERRPDGAVLGPACFVLRFFAGEPGGDRLLFVNLGADLTLAPAPEPLLAAPTARGWRTLWASEDPRYGGLGLGPVERRSDWLVPGGSAIVLAPAEGEG